MDTARMIPLFSDFSIKLLFQGKLVRVNPDYLIVFHLKSDVEKLETLVRTTFTKI